MPAALAIASDTGEPEPAPADPPLFENDSTNYTSSGSIKLTWRSQSSDPSDANVEFELQRATDRSFTDAHTYYRGPDLATYISGLANGNYYYRIREIRGAQPFSAWSVPVEVIVEHHTLNLAFTLFGIGAVVFLLTLIVVLRGASRPAVAAGSQDSIASGQGN